MKGKAKSVEDRQTVYIRVFSKAHPLRHNVRYILNSSVTDIKNLKLYYIFFKCTKYNMKKM